MQRIAVDMDEVLADTFAAQREWFQKEYGYCWPAAALAGRRLRDLVAPEHLERHEAVLRQGDFFADLRPMPESASGLLALCQRCEVFICTAAMDYPGSLRPKLEWLQRHFPFLRPSQLVFCGDKGILKADVLIDDEPRNLARFSGEGILFSAAHNRGETQYPRVSDWREVRELFESRATASLAGPHAS